jgi:hypothetical protein
MLVRMHPVLNVQPVDNASGPQTNNDTSRKAGDVASSDSLPETVLRACRPVVKISRGKQWG